MENGPKLDSSEVLERIGASIRDRFASQKRVLSFEEYLALFRQHPWRHSRDAARYLRDCFDHFGKETLSKPGGPQTRFKLFDLAFLKETDGRRRHDYLVGHEDIQQAFYRVLGNFVREGRINKLVMLHGPNGSAKTTFVHCMMKGLEAYSETDDGALYVFSWIFPRGRDGRTVGFGSNDDSMMRDGSFAHLPDAQIDLRMVSELRESPLLLLPRPERRRLVRDAYEAANIQEVPTALVMEGQLGAKNKQIFEALLTAYRGDLRRVLAHVRVERFYVSERYRQAAVTVGPQMAVDAQERQITMDRSLAALPASLASLSLYETHGELVDASGGLLEFSDLLKRPLDAWRYLLLAVEEGEIALAQSVLPLNAVFVSTSNDIHLKAFREHHEYRSFRGRLSLVRVPYLLDYKAEQGIYDAQIVPQVRTHVAPHATYVAALWATLTRLRRPQTESYENKKLGQLASSLTPIEKAEYYADLVIPNRFSNEESQILRANFAEVKHETDTWPNYEGSTGASPREIRVLLLDAAQDPAFKCLSPLAVLARIRELCEADDYDFLKETPEGGYHDHRGFVDVVRERWLDRVDDEFRRSTGLVEETQYLDLFDKYVTHVSNWVKRERVYNPVTGQYEEPDQKLMENVEGMLGVQRNNDSFRRDLISAVAAHALDHPGEKVSYPRLFPRYIQQVREATYGKRKKQLAEIARDVIATVNAETAHLDAERIARAKGTVERLEKQVGYAEPSIRDAIGELLRRRYEP
ncbi:PrkA family serine protein kinase [Sandaracinus amylolyticus]|uniref:Serine protein kinase (PrkA protein), P-loop containing n=1 Tax=Sandaracinus amylolyticus TaxID=927083 RepID=A0A0F6W3P6_9BACT|nr:serine protein kinase PrkA [Sandaracinus amylolyticus]AKF06617.1 Serine protein kinase (prkA protein), P-loop containing [Sandaracinus amylolyticus]